MSDLDHIPSDDPPGADSSPMSELQRAGLLAEHTGPSEYQTVADELEQTDHMIVSCRKLLGSLEGKYARLLGRLADLESKPGVPRQDVSTALAEHTQPALDKLAYGSAAEALAAEFPEVDPFAGIPNSDDSDNERL